MLEQASIQPTRIKAGTLAGGFADLLVTVGKRAMVLLQARLVGLNRKRLLKNSRGGES